MRKSDLITQCITLLVLCTLAQHSQAQRIGARFLNIRPSAEAVALGGCGITLERSDYESYYNPALLAYRKDLTFSLSLVNPITGFGQNNAYAQVASYLSNNLVMALSANMVSESQQLRTDQNGGIHGTFKPSDMDLKLSLAYNINKKLSFGTSLHKVSCSIAPATSSTRTDATLDFYAIDLGIVANDVGAVAPLMSDNNTKESTFFLSDEAVVSQGLSLSAVLRNIGTRSKSPFADEPVQLPANLCLGARYTLARTNATRMESYLELEDRIGENKPLDFARAGLDFSLYRFLHLRWGYNQSISSTNASSISGGVGLSSRYFRFDIARFSTPLLAVYQYSFSLRFPL